MSKGQNINTAISLEKEGEIRKALDVLYKYLDTQELLDQEDLLDIDISEMGTNLLVGFLTISSYHINDKTYLKLYNKIESSLKDLEPERCRSILKGLKDG